MEEKHRTAIYLRISQEDAQPEMRQRGREESNSISSQRKYLLEYIGRDTRLADSEVIEFCDDGFTGTNMERPGMQEMLKQVRQNRIGCILVKDMSRFSRDYIEMGTYLNQIFPFMGVDFIAINDGYDSREHGGAAITLDLAFKTLLYDLYSKDVSVKVKASFDSKCAGGEYVFGQVPLGYEKSREVKNKVIVNKREAEIVRYIFSLAAEGMSTAQIVKKLYAQQIPTARQLRSPDKKPSKGKHIWSMNAVRRILDNRFYIGEMAYGKTICKSVGSKDRIAVPKSEWKVIENHHEPLVTSEMFARAAKKALGCSAKTKREKHPLTGKIYCGGCGYALRYKPRQRKHPQHFWCDQHAFLQIPECCTYMNASILEEMVLTLLTKELMHRGDLLRQRGDLEQFQKRILEELAGKAREYRKQYHGMQKEKDSLYENYADGQMDAREYRCSADQLDGQMEELAGKIKAVETEQDRGEEEAGKVIQDMKQIIHYLHLEELTQEVVDAFIKKVTVYKGKRMEIEWDYSE